MCRSYSRDPKWIQVKFSSECKTCASPIPKGARAFWYPATKEVLCEADGCGSQASREFEAAKQDEAVYNGQTW